MKLDRRDDLHEGSEARRDEGLGESVGSLPIQILCETWRLKDVWNDGGEGLKRA